MNTIHPLPAQITNCLAQHRINYYQYIRMSSTSPKPKVIHLGSIDQCVPSFFFPRTIDIHFMILTFSEHSAQVAWSALSDIAELVESSATNRAEFIQECKDGKLDGVVAIYRTIGSVALTGLVDEELLNVLPSSLRYIAHCGESRLVYECSNGYMLTCCFYRSRI